MEVTKYHLPPTALMPNSPLPLLHYRRVVSLSSVSGSDRAVSFHDLCRANGWAVQWIYRYGATQRSHYHSTAHECMFVLSGSATIRFGVADTSEDMDDNTWGEAREDGGVEIEAQAGDVFILPAGLAHKTHNTRPEAEFKLLTPGDGHHIAAEDSAAALRQIELDGFTMCGAYPSNAPGWDSMKGGEQDADGFKQVWAVPKPERDPVLGASEQGLVGIW